MQFIFFFSSYITLIQLTQIFGKLSKIFYSVIFEETDWFQKFICIFMMGFFT